VNLIQVKSLTPNHHEVERRRAEVGPPQGPDVGTSDPGAAKLHGLTVDRSEIRSLNVNVDLDLLSDEELAQLQDLLAQGQPGN
jgi:hypothetical protein